MTPLPLPPPKITYITKIYMSFLNHYIRRLPQDIVEHIIGYTRQYQPLLLRKDIESFTQTKREMIGLYRNYWAVYWAEEMPDYTLRMVNDIICYIHLTIPRHNYIMNRISLFRKSGERYKSFKEFRQYHRRIQRNGVNTVINVYWGILRPDERISVYSTIKTRTFASSLLLENYLFRQSEIENIPE